MALGFKVTTFGMQNFHLGIQESELFILKLGVGWVHSRDSRVEPENFVVILFGIL